MKKIVCHITSVHPANDVRIFHKECISLVENGYQVHLVAGGNLMADSKRIIHHPLILKKKRVRLWSMINRSFRAYRLAQSTPATLFHFHDPELLPYGLLLKWQGKIVIYDAHEDLPLDVMMKDWIPRCLRKITAWFVERVENFIVLRLNMVIAATPGISARFQKIGANSIEINNYPKIGEFSSNLFPVNLKNNFTSICYVGIISLQRGIVELIHAIETMDVNLIIAGTFVDSKTEKMVRTLPGWKKIDFRGAVSRQEIALILLQSAVGLCVFHPTKAHVASLPNKLFEYMSAGLPIDASNFLIWDSIVQKLECGLCVDPMSPVKIRNAIQWILCNPSIAKEMGERGKRAVHDYYNWQAEEKKLIKSYKCFFK